jgi:hypothetical protein
MAYEQKYYFGFDDRGGNTHQLYIYQDGYSGSVIDIDYGAEEPIEINSLGGDKDNWEETAILPQELIFRFYVSQDDLPDFEDIFDAQFREYKVIYYLSGNDVPIYEGFLKPENLTKIYDTNPPFVEIQMPFTDGLSDLKGIDFTDDDDRIIVGQTTLLQILKYALTKTGIIGGAFYVSIPFYPVGGTLYRVLEQVTIDARRFIQDNGVPMKCWDVIEAVLLPLSAKLYHKDDAYYIIRYTRFDSQSIYAYLWTTLALYSTTGIDFTKEPALFEAGIEHQRVQPLKEVQTIFRNKDFGGDVTGITIMNTVNWDDTWDEFNQNGTAFELIDYDAWSTNTDYIQLTSDFSVTKTTDSDYLKINFEHRGRLVRDSATPTPNYNIPFQVFVYIRKDAGAWQYVSMGVGDNRSMYYQSPIIDLLKITEDADYNVRIQFRPYGTAWTYAIFDVKNITINKIINTTNPDESQVAVLDKGYRQFNLNGDGYMVLESEILIGDGNSITEIGALLISGGVTSNWYIIAPAGPTGKNGKFLDLYMQSILDNRISFKNYLRLGIIDKTFDHSIIDVIKIGTRYYNILSFKRLTKQCIVRLELIERDPEFNREYPPAIEFVLDTMNGKSINNYIVNPNPISDKYLYNTGDTGNGNYNFSSGLLYIDDTNSRVGIGTASPGAYKLDVNGTVRMNNTVTLTGIGVGTDNTVLVLNSSSQIVTDEIDSRVWGSSLVDYTGSTANRLAKFSDTNTITNSVIYENSGNIGVGDSPSVLFHIQGSTPILYLTDTDTGADCSISASSTTGSLTIQADVNNEVGDSSLNFGVDNTVYLSITSTGYFYFPQGILTSTDNTVLILNSSGFLATDEIDSRVWGSSLVDASGSSTNYVPKFSDANTITNSPIQVSVVDYVGIGGAPSNKLDVFGTFGCNNTVTFSGTPASTDNTVLLLNSINQVIQDEIDPRVWGSTLVDASSGTGNYIPKFSDANTIVNSTMQDDGSRVYVGLKMGVGDPTPDSRLNVYHNTTAEYACTIDQDHATGYGLRINVDGTTAIPALIVYDSSSNSLLRLNQDGKLGIGTAYPDPSAKLHVIDNTTAVYACTIDQDHATGYGLLINIDGTTAIPALKIQDATPTTLFIVEQGGNVGIGVLPSYKLDVEGGIRCTSEVIDGGSLFIDHNGDSPLMVHLTSDSSYFDSNIYTYLVSYSTSTAAPTNIFTFAVTNYRVYQCKARIIAGDSSAGGTYASYEIVYTFTNSTGEGIIQRGATALATHESSASFNAIFTSSGSNIYLQVTGSGSYTMYWNALVEIIEGVYTASV